MSEHSAIAAVSSRLLLLPLSLGHCLGSLVQPASPHSNAPGDPIHSRNKGIPLFAGLPLVNMVTHAVVFDPLSAMFGTFNDSVDTSRIALEGYEWNSMRQTFLTIPLLRFVRNTMMPLVLWSEVAAPTYG